MKTNIKKLSLVALSLGCCSIMHGMEDEFAARRTVQHAEPVDHTVEPSPAFRAVHSPTMMDERMSPRATRGVMSSASSFDDLEAQGSEGSFNMAGTAGVDAERPFEERHPRTAKALEAVRKRFQAVSDFFAKRGASPEEMPPATEQAATSALNEAVSAGQEEGLSWESIKARVKESTLGNMVGRARSAVSDFIDEKMHQMAHFGKTNYNDRRRAMKARHRDTVKTLEDAKTKSLNELKAKHDAEVVRMNQDFNEQVKANQKAQKEAIEKLGSDADKESLKRIKEGHKAVLDRMKADHDLNVAGKRLAHRQETMQLTRDFDGQLSRTRAANANELDELNAQIRTEVATGRAQDRHLAGRAKSWSNEVNGIERTRRSSMDATKTGQKSELDALRAKHQAKLDELDAQQKGKRGTKRAADARKAMIDRHQEAESNMADDHLEAQDRIDQKYDGLRDAATARFERDRTAIKNPEGPEAQDMRTEAATKLQRAFKRGTFNRPTVQAGGGDLMDAV